MPETPEQIFARLMPGYQLAQAKRTPEGYPYVQEEGEFEPGTYGQRSEGRPLVRVSPKAKPFELAHELRHVGQLYEGKNLDSAYNEEKLSNLYSSYGLPQEDAGWLAYAGKPSELDARRAAGDPDLRYKELLARVEALKARRQQVRPSTRASGGIGDPSRRP